MIIDSTIILDRITIDPPVAKIYRQLGFKKTTTKIAPDQQKETDRYIQEALSLISLKGSLLRLSINENDGNLVSLSGSVTLISAKLAAFLRDCREALLLGATAGSSIMNAIKEKTSEANLTAAVVYDATASEMTDAALDWLMSYMNRQLSRESKALLPRRFSAGYADLKLENQKTICEKLQMEKIGVTLTPSFILLPEKSVTAISGIL